MPILLALDASTPRTALALGTFDRGSGASAMIAAWSEEDGANQASTWLVEQLRALCGGAGIDLREVTAIACGQGPGTFTGTRVAVATAKGLALGLGVPCVPVSTLAAVAASSSSAAPGRVLALLDARRDEVYAGGFEVRASGVARLLDDRCAAIEDVLKDMPDPTCLIGPGVQAMWNRLPAALQSRAEATAGMTPAGLWRAAAAAALAGADVPAREFEAVYLRGSYAELGIHRPKRPMIRSPFID